MVPKKLLAITAVIGLLSLASFLLERLALTDIFHGEPNLGLEWTVVNAAFLPVILFHILALTAIAITLRRSNTRRRG